MANEAVILELNEYMDAKQYTCDASTNISKGTLLKLSGDNTVIATGDVAGSYVGVAAMDKDGTDSSTTISVYVPNSNNKFDITCSTAGVTEGAVVSISGANTIRDAVAGDLLTGNFIGKSMETGSSGEIVVVLS